jgi:streptomycin 6-kinase
MVDSYSHPFSQELITHVTAILGETGRAWLHDLPSLVNDLSAIWQLDVDAPFAAGEYNLVAPAMRGDGQPVVLKIAPPFADNEYIGEANFLSHRQGQGIVRLLERDPERRAILIERALPGKNLVELFTGSESEAIRPAIDVLRSILSEPPVDTMPKTLDQWFAGMRAAAGTDFPADYVAKAFEIYERLSPQPERTFYLHGDFHPGNIVDATRERFLAIDPKGVVGHVGYDIAVFLNNFHWWQETLSDVKQRLDRAVDKFAVAFGIQPHELHEWAFAQMVLGAWWNFSGMPDHYDKRTVAKADIWDV